MWNFLQKLENLESLLWLILLTLAVWWFSSNGLAKYKQWMPNSNKEIQHYRRIYASVYKSESSLSFSRTGNTFKENSSFNQVFFSVIWYMANKDNNLQLSFCKWNSSLKYEVWSHRVKLRGTAFWGKQCEPNSFNRWNKMNYTL